MIYPLGGLLFGAILGAVRARMRGGKLLDLLQWAAGFGLMFAVIGLFIMVFIQRQFA